MGVPKPIVKPKYRHLPELRRNGFWLNLASKLFIKYMQGNSSIMAQSQIIKQMGLSNQAFYRHLSYKPEKAEFYMKNLGLSKKKIGKQVYWELDIDVYKVFITNASRSN